MQIHMVYVSNLLSSNDWTHGAWMCALAMRKCSQQFPHRITSMYAELEFCYQNHYIFQWNNHFAVVFDIAAKVFVVVVVAAAAVVVVIIIL